MLRIQLLLLASLAFAMPQDIITTEQQLAAATANSSSEMQRGRIVGGWETSIAHFPHQVSLQMGTRHICGGTILSSSIILTAAHCVLKPNEPQLYAIRAGSTQWSSGGSYVRVRRIIRHEQFNSPTQMNNDIAVLLLQESLIYSNNIQPITLVMPADNVPARAQLFVSGWGSTSAKQLTTAPRLYYTAVVQLDRESCARNYFGTGTVTSTMFCAGSKSGLGDRDSCVGDSGGPLITKVADRFKLLGIVSWGLGCANAYYPGVYTRVSAYGGWLIQTLNSLD